MKTLMRWTIAGLACVSLSTAVLAQERGSKEEAKAMVDAAIEHVKKVGGDQAMKDFSTDKAKWSKKDLYVFVYDMKGISLAHGANEKLIGKDMSQVKDSNGKPIIVEMIKLVSAGKDGWVDYDWAHPVTKKIEPKSSYVRKLTNPDGFVGVGIYR
ncbi:MAG: cache domain-containing protein [Burkholderiaceae bacterium]|nr:cache domain-containing protein [Burkholderiaceae bacterium]